MAWGGADPKKRYLRYLRTALGHMGDMQVLRGDRKAQVTVTCGGGEALPPSTCITPRSPALQHPGPPFPLDASHITSCVAHHAPWQSVLDSKSKRAQWVRLPVDMRMEGAQGKHLKKTGSQLQNEGKGDPMLFVCTSACGWVCKHEHVCGCAYKVYCKWGMWCVHVGVQVCAQDSCVCV